MQRPFVVLACGLQGFLFKGVIMAQRKFLVGKF